MQALLWELSGQEGTVSIALVRDCLLTRNTAHSPHWTVAVYNGNPESAHAEGVRLTEHWQKVLPTLIGPFEVQLPIGDVQRARFDIDSHALISAVEAQLDKMREVL